MSLKSKFSIEETIILAQYFNISLDRLYGISAPEFVTIEKTKHIETEEQLLLYFEDSNYQSLLPITKTKGL